MEEEGAEEAVADGAVALGDAGLVGAEELEAVVEEVSEDGDWMVEEETVAGSGLEERDLGEVASEAAGLGSAAVGQHLEPRREPAPASEAATTAAKGLEAAASLPFGEPLAVGGGGLAEEGLAAAGQQLEPRREPAPALEAAAKAAAAKAVVGSAAVGQPLEPRQAPAPALGAAATAAEGLEAVASSPFGAQPLAAGGLAEEGLAAAGQQLEPRQESAPALEAAAKAAEGLAEEGPQPSAPQREPVPALEAAVKAGVGLVEERGCAEDGRGGSRPPRCWAPAETTLAIPAQG